jgi:hypothetical protein
VVVFLIKQDMSKTHSWKEKSFTVTQITVEGKLQKSRATVNVNKASIAFRNTNIKK